MKKELIALCTVLSLGMLSSAKDLVFQNHTYRVASAPKNWIDANKEAEAQGGYLVTIESKEENKFLLDALKDAGVRTVAKDGGGAVYAWLGASDIAREGDWHWINGARVSSGFSNWGSGSAGKEPDNFQGNQDALAIGVTGWPAANPGTLGHPGEWNDLNQNDRLAFVIEFDQAPGK